MSKRTAAAAEASPDPAAYMADANGVRHDAIAPDPANPRKLFDADALAQLAESIAYRGLIQPLVLRPADAGGVHLIVAGERRWRAIGLLATRGDWAPERLVPARVLEGVDAMVAAELALIENLQREDLNPMEEAAAFAALRDLHGLKTVEIASRIGRTQRHVQDRLQLLKLSEKDQTKLAEGKMGIQDARWALRNVEENEQLAALKPDESLLLGEILDKFDRQPKRKGGYETATECTHDAKSPALNRLKNLHLIEARVDEWGNGRNYLHAGYKLRGLVAAEAEVAKPIPPDENGLYQTAFLNGPFELSPKMAEAQAKKKAEAAEKRTRTKQAKQAAAERAAAFEALTADPPRFTPSPQLTALRELAARSLAPLPWTLDGDYGQILDANRAPIGQLQPGRWDNPADKDGIKAVFALLLAACAPAEAAAAEPAAAPSDADIEAELAAGDRRYASNDAFADQIRETADEDVDAALEP